ncbi:MAG: flagellar motor protein MotB [Desulfovibrionales bacterium]
MARDKKRKATAAGSGWLVTFCDIMTLLLTFFVLLISMASLTDPYKRLKALDSVFGAFGIGQHGTWDDTSGVNVLSTRPQMKAGEAGAFEDINTFEILKPLIVENRKRDLQLITNSFVQIFSVNAELLFDRGDSTLSEEGRVFLAGMVPLLNAVDYPIMVRGHTTILRDEFGSPLGTQDQGLDPSWRLSLDRVASVYDFLLEEGMHPEKIRVEGHGRFAPRFTNNTPEGRAQNRRVDFILDKRTATWAHLAATRSAPKDSGQGIRYKDFLFGISTNGTLGR